MINPFHRAFELWLTPLLAQELPAPDAEHLSSWLVDAAALAAILLVFLKVIDHFKRRPSLEQELEKLLRQLRTELNQVRHEQTEHLSEVRGRVEGAHQRVDLLTHDLNNKLQRLPGDIVDLLHKTGVLNSPR
jgi:predicted nuclease with TOPRIM domain